MLKRIAAAGVALTVCLFATSTAAEESDNTGKVLTIEDSPSPHWVWVTDLSYPSFLPGKAHLVDAASGRFLGMFTMGYGLSPLGLPRAGGEIYGVETHYDRTYRGNRTDVVTVYDARTLRVSGEIKIPPKKFSGVTIATTVGLTDDDRYLLVYNFTPAHSVSIVDVKARRFVGEIETAGCGLVLPTGERSFAMLCGDGQLMAFTFDEAAKVTAREALAVFDPGSEFLTEKAVRFGDSWLFVSNTGEIRSVDFSAAAPTPGPRFMIFTAAEREAGWRVGGVQHLALHHASSRLYVLAHQGGPDTHKDPGKDVFVLDATSGKRLQHITLDRDAGAIAVTQGGDSLLLTTNYYPAALDVYDAGSGKLLRQIDEVATAPMLLQTPVAQLGE